MMYARYILTVLAAIALVPVAIIAAPLVSLFTRDGWPKWAAIFATYDNPPQGDFGYQHTRSPFELIEDGIPGWVNRTVWLWRNPMYGFKKATGIKYDDSALMTMRGFDGVSDKYRRPGYYFAVLGSKAFEFYGVFPYSKKRCIRCRLGWKMLTPKFSREGFAPFVFTINPIDSYGDRHDP